MRALSARARQVVCLLVIALALTSGNRRARACASCDCGDPTLTAVGVEKPYVNRLRLALEERLGTHSVGAGLLRSDVLMSRSQLAVSYTPLSRLTLAALLPFVAARLHGPGDRLAWVRGLGELELSARVVVARDRAFAPRHLLWLFGGIKVPTAPRLHDDAGYPYPDDDQPGTGSWDPLIGATYAWFGAPVTLYSSLLLRYPTAGPRDLRIGPSLVVSSVAQLQPFRWLALQLGLDLRQDWTNRLANGAEAPNTGGFVVALTPGALFNPWRDLVLRVAVEVPVYQARNGVQSVGPQLVVSIAYDLL